MCEKAKCVIMEEKRKLQGVETNRKKCGDGHIDKTELQELGASCDFAKLVPADEQAVAKIPSNEEQEIVVTETITPTEDIIREIPEEELGTTDDDCPLELIEAKKCGCFAPTLGMTGIVTNTGRKIYAKIHVDTKGNRFIEFTQLYNDGSYSAKMRIAQADLMLAATYCFNPQKISDPGVKKKVSRILMDVSEDYLNKLAFPEEIIRISGILNILVQEYRKLSMELEAVTSQLERPDKLYRNVIKAIKVNMLDANTHNAYYALAKDQIEMIADDLNVKSAVLLKKLKEYHFLYLTESSEGYQTCVRFKAGGEFFPKPYTEWCYCILKLDYLAKKRMQGAEGTLDSAEEK